MTKISRETEILDQYILCCGCRPVGYLYFVDLQSADKVIKKFKKWSGWGDRIALEFELCQDEAQIEFLTYRTLSNSQKGFGTIPMKKCGFGQAQNHAYKLKDQGRYCNTRFSDNDVSTVTKSPKEHSMFFAGQSYASPMACHHFAKRARLNEWTELIEHKNSSWTPHQEVPHCASSDSQNVGFSVNHLDAGYRTIPSVYNKLNNKYPVVEDATHSSIPTNKLFITGLPEDMSNREFSHIFRPLNGFQWAKVFVKDAPEAPQNTVVLCGLCKFDTVENATSAMNTKQGYPVDLEFPQASNLSISYAWKKFMLHQKMKEGHRFRFNDFNNFS